MSSLVKQKKPSWNNMFTDVYDTLPVNLIEQQDELSNHVQKYKKEYKDLLKGY